MAGLLYRNGGGKDNGNNRQWRAQKHNPATKLNFHEIKSNLNNTIRLPGAGGNTSQDNKDDRNNNNKNGEEGVKP